MKLVESIRRELGDHADEEYRAGCFRFFKEEVHVIGVRSADLKAIERSALGELKKLSRDERYVVFEELWRGGTLEEGAMVGHLARKFKREFGKTEFKIFERWTDQYVHNWSHCDAVSGWLIAGCIENDPALRDSVLKWVKSKNRWKRRASVVGFLQEAKSGRSFDYITEIATKLEKDVDDMVQKGVGWVLKEAYPKRPEEVLEFLRLRAFPRLVVRYAAEKMTKADRAELGLR